MILRIRNRQTFGRLSANGVRVRSSVLWCICCPDSTSTGPSVAFALTRALGTAVTRNRLRRRLLALLREIDHNEPLPSALMMIGAKPAATELTFDQLATELQILMRKAGVVCKS